MDTVRVGIIGYGNMASAHAEYIYKGEINGARLTAICDTDTERLKKARENFGDTVKLYSCADEIITSKEIDAIIIATPHYDHPPLAIKALNNDLHTLIEKPAGVYTKQVNEMNTVAKKSHKLFGIMYNQRTNPVYKKLKDLVDSGELGEIKRTNWIITSWYRPQSYYNSGGWRASWSGEGGGVLLNQDPHQLDLWQWTCGMPKRVRAFMSFGKYHDIEVENDVTAYVEYENGATGVFVTSTADTPGTNRLEVTADMGKIVIEDEKLTFWRLRTPERQFNKDFTGGFGVPECWKCEIPTTGENSQHKGITQNFINAILKGEKLLAPGIEGINGLEISNAMHLSAWLDAWVELPVDEDIYFEKLKGKMKSSTYVKPVTFFY